MASELFIMSLFPKEAHLFLPAAKLTGRTEADLGRSMLLPAMESTLAGKKAEDVEFEKKLLAEEEVF